MSRVSILTVILKSEWWIKVLRPNQRDRISKETFAITNNKRVRIKSKRDVRNTRLKWKQKG